MNISNERLEKSEDVLSFVLQIVGSASILGAIGTSLIAYGEELEECRS
jgi:small ligand-binding sensory domain FIST